MSYANVIFGDPAFLEAPEEEQEQGNAGNTPKEQFCNAGYTVIKTGAICLGAISGVTLAIYLVTSNKDAILRGLAYSWDKFGKFSSPPRPPLS